MSTRPTPERLAEIRESNEDRLMRLNPSSVSIEMKELFAEIDALIAERDKFAQERLDVRDIMAIDYSIIENERDQWRAYAEKMRGALEVIAENDRAYAPAFAKAREALNLPRPGSSE